MARGQTTDWQDREHPQVALPRDSIKAQLGYSSESSRGLSGRGAVIPMSICTTLS